MHAEHAYILHRTVTVCTARDYNLAVYCNILSGLDLRLQLCACGIVRIICFFVVHALAVAVARLIPDRNQR